MPDKKVVAENLTATTFEDKALGDYSKYYYLIQANTKIGAGAVVQTAGVLAGNALVPPLDLKTDRPDNAAVWQSVGGFLFDYNDYNQSLTANSVEERQDIPYRSRLLRARAE